MDGYEQPVLLCYQCGNRAPHKIEATHTGKELYEHIDGKRFLEDAVYLLYRCLTCQGLNFYRDYSDFPRHSTLEERRFYPEGGQLLPEKHKLGRPDPVPARIVATYLEIWPLRHISPNAFGNQIRRALEMICKDQKAEGKTLYAKLRFLAERGTFPGYFAEMTDLMREVANLGSHADEHDLDFWDAELLDDFFRSVVEYVYLAPVKIERLRQRIGISRT